MLANRFGLLQANTSTFFFLIVSNLNLLSLRSDWSVIGKLRKQILGIQFLYKLEWRCDRGRLRALVNYSYFVCGCTCFTDCWDLIQKLIQEILLSLLFALNQSLFKAKWSYCRRTSSFIFSIFWALLYWAGLFFSMREMIRIYNFFLEEISVPIMISISCL